MVFRGIRSMAVVAAALAGAMLLAALDEESHAQSQPAGSCAGLQLQTAQIRCFLDAAEAAKDPGICESADDPLVRLHCLSLYAERSRDIGPCQRIGMGDEQTETLRDSCIAGVAVAGRDPSVCGRVGRPEVRDACYLMLVTQFDADSDICGRIENPKVRALCNE